MHSPEPLPCHTQVFLWYNLGAMKMNRTMSIGKTLIVVFLIVLGWLLPADTDAAHERVAAVTSPVVHNLPELHGYVNDYAGMISPEAISQMEEQLKTLEQSDSTQIFVLTVPSLEGKVLEEFAIKVFDAWKAGQKNIDNGVILIVAQKERKIRIEVGRGLEGKLTDLLSGRIIDTVIKPKFKSGDFEGGFLDGVAALIEATKGEFKAAGAVSRQTPVYRIRADRLCYFLISIIVMIVIVSKLSRRNRGQNFDRLNSEAQKKILDMELETGWGMALGISAITIPVIAFITILQGGDDRTPDGFPWVGLLICSIVGLVIGMFTKVISNQLGVKGGGGRGGWSSGGSGSGGWSSGGSSDSGSSSDGGGGSSGGGGASGDY